MMTVCRKNNIVDLERGKESKEIEKTKAIKKKKEIEKTKEIRKGKQIKRNVDSLQNE